MVLTGRPIGILLEVLSRLAMVSMPILAIKSKLSMGTWLRWST